MIRGIRLRLALALLLVVAGALGVVYLIVVPSLEDRLVDAKLSQLEEDARTRRGPARGRTTRAYQLTREVSASVVNSRVVIYGVIETTPPLLTIFGDSNTSSSLDVERDPVRGAPRDRAAAARDGGAGQTPLR